MNERPAKEVLTLHQGGRKCMAPLPHVVLTYEVNRSSLGETDKGRNPGFQFKFISIFPPTA